MLSRRAQENNAWFQEQFKRPLQRQGSPSASNIDLATAENWIIRPEILLLLKKNIRRNFGATDLSYASGLGGSAELLKASSAFFNRFFSPKIPIKPEHIVTGAGCSSVLDTLINDLCDRGDGVLVMAPMWGSFEVSAVMRNGVRLIPVHIPIRDTHSAQAVVAAYRTAAENASCDIRGILFCNPHNPYGHISPTEVIDSLLQYCEEENLHFISDEIYALSTFGKIEQDTTEICETLQSPTANFASVLSRDLKKLGVNQSRVHMLYSVSKDFGISGIRLGYLVTQANNELRLSQAILNNARLCNAAAAMVAPILEDTTRLATLVDLNIRRLRGAARIAIQFAEFHGLAYYRPVAGVYIWLRLSKECETGDDEEDLVRRCAQQGVLVGSGSDYAESRPGWFRLTFSLPGDEFIDGLRRLEAALSYKGRFEYNQPSTTWYFGFMQRWRGMCK